MSTIEVDVVVIGGGPAGIAAAREAAREGASVALVESEGPGGRAARSTTVPLRIFTSAADTGLKDWEALRREITDRAAAWSHRLSLGLEDAGVELLHGRARFTSSHTLGLGDARTVAFERAVIAAGAEPATLAGAPADGARVLVPDQLAGLAALPAEAMVIGGGPAGAEISDVLSRLGTRVTWLMDELGILPAFDRELADAVGDVLMGRGVKLVHGKAVTELATGTSGALAKLEGGRTYASPIAIVAVGNRPQASSLGLEAAGVSASSRGAILVDDRCRTSAPHVLAAGDVTGQSAGVAGAEAMGRVAGREAAGASGAPYVPAHVPRVVYTRPEAAQVGLSPESAAGREVVLHTLRAEETLAGHLAHIGERADAKGFVRVVCASDDGRMLGASALGPGAADAVSAAALMLALGATDAQLATASALVPSAIDALVRAAR